MRTVQSDLKECKSEYRHVITPELGLHTAVKAALSALEPPATGN